MKLNAARLCNLFCLQLLGREEDLREGECIVFMYLSVKTLEPVFSSECRMMMWIPDVVGHGQFIITPTFPSSISVPTRGIMWPDKTEECSTCHHMGQSV